MWCEMCPLVIPSVSEGPGGAGGDMNFRFRAARPPRSLAYARDDGVPLTRPSATLSPLTRGEGTHREDPSHREKASRTPPLVIPSVSEGPGGAGGAKKRRFMSP